MKGKAFLLWGFWGICMSISQMAWGQASQAGKTLVDSFPTIRFNIHDRDPEPHPKEYFTLKEGPEELSFEVSHTTPQDSDAHKDILILWEYLPHSSRAAQNKYFKDVLKRGIEGLVGEGDHLQVATFAWTQKDKPTLYFLEGDFPSNQDTLLGAINKAQSPNGKGVMQDHGSELFIAIKEGIGHLAASKAKAKMLIVLSAEFPNIYNSSEDIVSCTVKGRKADVAVYNLRYRVMDPKYSLNELAKGTYGMSEEANPSDVEDGINDLLGFSKNGILRSLGLNYQFSLVADHPKDGALHTLQLSMAGGTAPLSILYEPPSMGMGEWIKANLVLSISMLLALLLIGGGSIYWVKKKGKQREAELAEERKKVGAVEAQNKANEEKLRQQGVLLKDMQSQSEKQRTEAERKKEKEQADAEEKRLLAEMFANGKNPRLTTQLGGKLMTMELPSPVTAVGRDAGNDLVISDPTVSRNQFQIVYQAGTYTVLDLGSTNGTFLNGERIGQSVLKHGDQIKAGNVVLTFYL